VDYINVGQIADRSVYVSATTDTNVLTYPPHSRAMNSEAHGSDNDSRRRIATVQLNNSLAQSTLLRHNAPLVPAGKMPISKTCSRGSKACAVSLRAHF
jgi:hypothetical protein